MSQEFQGHMLICRNAEEIDRQRKVGNPCSRVITKLFNKTMQTLSAKLSKEGTHGVSEKGGPEAASKFLDFA